MPPAIRSPFGKVANSVTHESIPVPRAVQETPFHRAMWLALTLPAVVKNPPATSSPFGRIAKSLTSPFVPAPRDVQVLLPGS